MLTLNPAFPIMLLALGGIIFAVIAAVAQAQLVPIIPETGFYPFYFGQSGSYAYQTFQLTNPTFEPVVIQVTDCYCSGDAFIVLVNGQLYSTVSNGCQPGDASCQAYSADVATCYQNQQIAWCQDSAPVLGPGTYNISILVTNSPYYSGKAFIGVFNVCNSECGAKRKSKVNLDVLKEKFRTNLMKSENQPQMTDGQRQMVLEMVKASSAKAAPVEKAVAADCINVGCQCGQLCCVLNDYPCAFNVYDWEEQLGRGIGNNFDITSSSSNSN